jgi:MFS family permease
MNGPLTQPQKHQGTRLKFAAMVGVYFFGSLNDNFYRQCALMLTVVAGLKLQGHIMFLFALPFILFASYAGFLADRFPKRSVIIAARCFAVVAFIIGAAGLYLLNWPIIITTVFILGLQAIILSPSIYGSIPELYPPERVVFANSIFSVIANSSILLGIAGAGMVLDLDAKGTLGNIPLGRLFAIVLTLIIAAAALIISFYAPRFPAASPKARFPWQGPWESVVTLYSTRRQPLLAVSIFAKAFFWFAGSLQIMIINALGLAQIGLSKSLTSALVVVELVGIAAGSLLAPLLAKGPKWYRVLVPSVLIMAGSMFAIAFVLLLPYCTQTPVLIGALFILGMSAGIFSVPLTSFVQTAPAPDLKGRIIAASNFADFTGILLSGAIFHLFDRADILPTNCFAIEGIIVLAVVGWLLFVLPEESENA